MTNSHESDSFGPDQPDKPQQGIETWVPVLPILSDRISSGFEPMGEIQLQGRASGRSAAGQSPWWVLIAGWLMLGGLAFVAVHFLITDSVVLAMFLLAIGVLLLLVLGRGTCTKLSQ